MKINFFAPINNLGYGMHSWNLIRVLDMRGHKICLIPPFGSVEWANDLVNKWLDERKHFDPNVTGVMIFHEDFLGQFCGKPRIGFPVFEFETFTETQIAFMKSCDALMVATEWAKGVMEKNGIKKRIFVVPEGYDPQVFKVIEKSNSELDDEPFTFSHIGKAEERKGTNQIIRCFARAMEGKEANLIMHIRNPFRDNYDDVTKAINAEGFKQSASDPNIFLRAKNRIRFTQPMDMASMRKEIFQKTDCAVYPSRAEGWGLPIIESIVSGIPTIVGRWTGQSEYLTEDYPKEIALTQFDMEQVYDPIFFPRVEENREWRVVRDLDLIDRMTWAFHQARKFRQKEEWKNAVEAVRKFTWENSAEKFEEAMKWANDG